MGPQVHSANQRPQKNLTQTHKSPRMRGTGAAAAGNVEEKPMVSLRGPGIYTDRFGRQHPVDGIGNTCTTTNNIADTVNNTQQVLKDKISAVIKTIPNEGRSQSPPLSVSQDQDSKTAVAQGHQEIDGSRAEMSSSRMLKCNVIKTNQVSLGQEEPDDSRLCHYYQRGHCRRGVACHFRHSVPVSKIQDPEAEHTIISNEKKYLLHPVICRHYFRSQNCKAGFQCRWLHTNSEIALIDTDSETFDEVPIYKLWFSDPRLCRANERRMCLRGKDCRYKHIPVPGTSSHVCQNFIRNSCPWGPLCNRRHIRTNETNQVATDEDVSANESTSLEKINQEDKRNQPANDIWGCPHVDWDIEISPEMGSDPSTADSVLERRSVSPISDGSSSDSFWYLNTDASDWGDTRLYRSFSSSRTSLCDDIPDGKLSLSQYPDTGWHLSTNPSDWFDSLATSKPPIYDESSEKHPPPRYSETCWKWLQNRCNLGYDCLYVHGDLEYDAPPTSSPADVPKPTFSQWSLTLHEYMKVKLGPGLIVESVITGFETLWIQIMGLPAQLTTSELSKLLSQYGTVREVKFFNCTSSTASAKASFSSYSEAQAASAALDGSRHWDHLITSRLSLHVAAGRTATIQDTAIRIDWEAPSKTAYAGYPNLERAKSAIDIAKRDYTRTYISARLHEGLPAVGLHTVRFQNLPIKAEAKFMKQFAHPDDVMWDKPNYANVELAANGIRRILELQGLDPEKFDVLPAPYRDGRVRAWAYFSSPTAAKAAQATLHKRKPACTGRTRIYAAHKQTLTYPIPLTLYLRAEKHIDTFRATLWRMGRRDMVLAILRTDANATPIAKLSADDTKTLGELKAELERILRGEIVRDGSKTVWNDFFACSEGRVFLRRLEGTNDGVTIELDSIRRRIRLFGQSDQRATVRQELIKKDKDILSSGELRTTLIPRHLIGLFIGTQLGHLTQRLGSENVMVNMWSAKLTIRGSLRDFRAAQDAVKSCRNPVQPSRPNLTSCPVCFGEVEQPISLSPCQHSYCRTCLVNYIMAAKDHRFFPLTCLGDGAKCSNSIPVSVARNVLPSSDFQAVAEAALASHIDAHQQEFHYCPSPDCMQVYRAAEPGTILQCPTCLIRICPQCHVEYHEGFACSEMGGADGDALFKEWMESHDVKHCPECRVPIERAEGCNHVTCTRCSTHICWVCMDTFPRGEGIYAHMRLEHGGIGLED